MAEFSPEDSASLTPDRRFDRSASEESTVEVAAFLAREHGGSAAWREFLAQHPQHAASLQRQLASLRTHGMLGEAAKVPDRVGPFRLMRRLGLGGMGVVYLGRDDAGAEVAIKRIRPELMQSNHHHLRFEREIAALRQLSHPGIVRFVAAGTEAGTPWLATDYLPGRSLAEALAEVAAIPAAARRATHLLGTAAAAAESTSWDQHVARLLRDVANALHAAHCRGITHRDLKPSNIRLLPDGQPVLIDFGLACFDAATTITNSGTLVGSLPYMAPELLRHGGDATPRSDVYSLGVVLYEALAGSCPFSGESFAAVRSQVIDADPIPLLRLRPRLQPELAAVCRRAMDPDPAHRYASAAEFAADLERARRGERIMARPAPRHVRAARWLRRRPLRSVALVSGLLLATVVPTVLAVQQAAALHASYRLSDLHLVGELAEREPMLWPAVPQLLPGEAGLLGWLETAAMLATRLPQHREALGRVRSRGRKLPASEATAHDEVARGVWSSWRGHEHNLANAKRTQPAGWQDWVAELELHAERQRRQFEELHCWRFADPADAQEHRRLATLVVALEDLPRLRAQVERRIATVHQLAAAMQQHSAAWQACCRAIGELPVYRGLQLQPIFGLLPLGADPQSGLYEFAHLPSGPPARRDPDTGRLVVADDTGIVLVLLPGGQPRVGADAAGGPHHDPLARDNERPSHRFDCDPFLIAKWELTHAQWLRFEHNRSLFKPDHVPPEGGPPVSLRHPIDGVAKVDIVRVAQRMGLELPTGRQWEYAARGGTDGPWWTGPDPASLLAAEVLRGSSTSRISCPRAVGSGRPNPFGLFDVLGNVEEWCADAVRDYASEAPGAGDGRSSNLDTGSVRGGSFGDRELPRVSRRRDEPATSPLAGARLVLRLR